MAILTVLFALCHSIRQSGCKTERSSLLLQFTIRKLISKLPYMDKVYTHNRWGLTVIFSLPDTGKIWLPSPCILVYSILHCHTIVLRPRTRSVYCHKSLPPCYNYNWVRSVMCVLATGQTSLTKGLCVLCYHKKTQWTLGAFSMHTV